MNTLMCLTLLMAAATACCPSFAGQASQPATETEENSVGVESKTITREVAKKPIAKLVPEVLDITLDACLADPKCELKAAYDSDQLVKEVVDMARPLEGLIRQDSIHAAGVVISEGPLTDHLPLMQITWLNLVYTRYLPLTATMLPGR